MPLKNGSIKNEAETGPQEIPRGQLESLIKAQGEQKFQQVLLEVVQLLKQFPNSASLHSFSGAAYLGLGKLGPALESYENAIVIQPDDFKVHNIKGHILRKQGKSKEAEIAFEKAISIKPDYALALNNLGIVFKDKGKLKKAMWAFQKAINIKPNYANALNNMGTVFKSQGHLKKAIKAFQRVISIKPDYAEAYNNLGIALKEQGKLQEAVGALRIAVSLQPRYAKAYNNMGAVLLEQGELDEAIKAYNKALSYKPEHSGGYNNLGNALKDNGRLEEAIDAYKKAISIKPDNAQAHRHLSAITKYTLDNDQVAVVNSLINSPEIQDTDKCHLLYTYAKINEDLGDLNLAFDSYVAGGRLRKKELAYDFNGDQNKFQKIKQHAPSLLKHALPVLSHQLAHCPIFIVGMPRSGTTLVEQILSCHSQINGAGELSFLHRFGALISLGKSTASAQSLKRVRDSYLHELKRKSGDRPFITDKMPHNFRYIGLICSAIPEAKIIHVKRDPAATCWSNFKHYFSSKGLGYSYDITDTVEFFKLYQNLMNFWVEMYGDRIYHLDYESLTTDQATVTRKLIDHIGIGWDKACLSPQKNTRSIKTASQQQVRQKVYKGSSQSWRKFEPFLAGRFDDLTVNASFK